MWVESTRVTIQVGGVHTGGESGLELSCKQGFSDFFHLKQLGASRCLVLLKLSKVSSIGPTIKLHVKGGWVEGAYRLPV